MSVKMAPHQGKERPQAYFKCWGVFADLLLKEGINPAEHRAEFDEEWELSMTFLPQKEAEGMAELLAKEVIKAAVPPPKVRPPPVVGPPPKVPVPLEGLDKLIWELNTGAISYEEYERRVRELKK